MTTLPILYSFRRCPYAMRARMAIAVSGIEVELREVVLRNKPPELVAASPKATVPVLVLPDGTVIDESLDIMHWALRPDDPEDSLESAHAELIQRNDNEFKSALDRYKYPQRYSQRDGLIDRDQGLTFLMELDAMLGEQPFLGGKSRGMSDVAIFPFVRQFSATDQAWFDAQPLPGLHRWLAEFLQSDLFAGVMLRYPQWKTGDEAPIFP